MGSLFSFLTSGTTAPAAPAAAPAQGTLRIGLGQLLVEGGEPERNLARAEIQVAQAAAMGCELILLPETMDFAWTHPSGLREAQPIPGAYSQRLCSAAAKHSIYVCAGLTERGSNGIEDVDADDDVIRLSARHVDGGRHGFFSSHSTMSAAT